jgi:hypothetical protein
MNFKPKLHNRALFIVRQAHHDGHPELVEGKTTMKNSNA